MPMDFGEIALYLQFLQAHLARAFHFLKMWRERSGNKLVFNHFIPDKSSVTHAPSGKLTKSISENWWKLLENSLIFIIIHGILGTIAPRIWEKKSKKCHPQMKHTNGNKMERRVATFRNVFKLISEGTQELPRSPSGVSMVFSKRPLWDTAM